MKRVEEAVARIQPLDPARASQVEGFVGDLASPNDIARLWSAHSEFDIVINNLGVYESKSYEEISVDDWRRMFETNVIGGAEVTRAYSPGMLRRNWGRVVFISSETAVNVPGDMIHYGASKAAQVALARGLAEATRGTGVTVNSVLPGPTLSEGINRFLDDVVGGGGDREQKQRDFLLELRPTSLLQRFATADEVASFVTYVASPLAAATNGAALRVEGGLLRHAF